MQQTFHKPDETEGQHGLRMAATLDKDYEFADYSMADYDERSSLIMQGSRATVWFVRNLFFYTKKRWILRVGWILEFVANVLLLTVMGMEIRSECIIEFGYAFMCYSCFGLPFLTWIFTFSFLWLLNVYMHVLLISRGFAFPKKFWNAIDHNRKRGIPGIAVIVFIFLLCLMLAMIIGGIVLLIHSNSCPTTDHVAGVRTLKRSTTLFWAIIFSMIFAIIVLPFVRFSEIIWAKKTDEQNADKQKVLLKNDDYGTPQKYYGKAHEYYEKAHDKAHQYYDKAHDKAHQYYDKAQDKARDQYDKYRNHGQYLDKYQTPEQAHGSLSPQSL